MSKQYLKTEIEALICYNEFAGECFDKDGAADLISTEEMITLLKAADEREICENCIHGEQCYVEEDKQHCNIYDKSFEKNHSCDSVEVDKTK